MFISLVGFVPLLQEWATGYLPITITLTLFENCFRHISTIEVSKKMRIIIEELIGLNSLLMANGVGRIKCIVRRQKAFNSNLAYCFNSNLLYCKCKM